MDVARLYANTISTITSEEGRVKLEAPKGTTVVSVTVEPAKGGTHTMMNTIGYRRNHWMVESSEGGVIEVPWAKDEEAGRVIYRPEAPTTS